MATRTRRKKPLTIPVLYKMIFGQQVWSETGGTLIDICKAWSTGNANAIADLKTENARLVDIVTHDRSRIDRLERQLDIGSAARIQPKVELPGAIVHQHPWPGADTPIKPETIVRFYERAISSTVYWRGFGSGFAWAVIICAVVAAFIFFH